MANFRPDDLTDLPGSWTGTDKQLVSSAGVLKQSTHTKLHGGFFSRKPTAIVKPVAGDFGTWLNQGVAVLTDNGDALSLTHANSITTGRNIVGRYRNLPSGNWDVQIQALKLWNNRPSLVGGLFLYESATGKIEIMGFGVGGSSSVAILQSTKYTNSTTFSADRRTSSDQHGNPLFIRARRWGLTNFRFLISVDGFCWGEYTSPALLTNFFTTAPDKWGFALDVANSSATLPQATRLDVLHWEEHTDTDVWEKFTNYENSDGNGDRLARITVTTSLALTTGTIDLLVNGLTTNQVLFTATQTGKHITFQFAEAKIIDQVTVFGSGTTSQGVWKWQGSNNGSSWTDISAGFTFTGGGGSGTVQGDLSANTTAYLYYRLQGVSGNTSAGANINEFNFRIKKG